MASVSRIFLALSHEEDEERLKLKERVKKGKASHDEVVRFGDLRARHQAQSAAAPLTGGEQVERKKLKAKVIAGTATDQEHNRFEKLKARNQTSKDTDGHTEGAFARTYVPQALPPTQPASKEASPEKAPPVPLSDEETKERIRIKERVKEGSATAAEIAQFEVLRARHKAISKFTQLTGGEQVERKKLKAKIAAGAATDQETVRFEKLKLRNRISFTAAGNSGNSVAIFDDYDDGNDDGDHDGDDSDDGNINHLLATARVSLAPAGHGTVANMPAADTAKSETTTRRKVDTKDARLEVECVICCEPGTPGDCASLSRSVFGRAGFGGEPGVVEELARLAARHCTQLRVGVVLLPATDGADASGGGGNRVVVDVFNLTKKTEPKGEPQLRRLPLLDATTNTGRCAIAAFVADEGGETSAAAAVAEAVAPGSAFGPADLTLALSGCLSQASLGLEDVLRLVTRDMGWTEAATKVIVMVGEFPIPRAAAAAGEAEPVTRAEGGGGGSASGASIKLLEALYVLRREGVRIYSVTHQEVPDDANYEAARPQSLPSPVAACDLGFKPASGQWDPAHLCPSLAAGGSGGGENAQQQTQTQAQTQTQTQTQQQQQQQQQQRRRASADGVFWQKIADSSGGRRLVFTSGAQALRLGVLFACTAAVGAGALDELGREMDANGVLEGEVAEAFEDVRSTIGM